MSFGNHETTGHEGDGEGELGKFPPCEPCCLDKLAIGFPRETNPELGLLQLVLVVRLWRKLREHGCCGYSFDQLRDICEVLQLFTATGVNPEFIRQLAAFQMLRDDFHLPLAESTPSTGATGVARSPLLALWATPQATAIRLGCAPVDAGRGEPTRGGASAPSGATWSSSTASPPNSIRCPRLRRLRSRHANAEQLVCTPNHTPARFGQKSYLNSAPRHSVWRWRATCLPPIRCRTPIRRSRYKRRTRR